MALPTIVDLSTLDYPYNGGPFCVGTPNSSTDLDTLDYVNEALPFESNPGTTSTTNISISITESLIASLSRLISVTKSKIINLSTSIQKTVTATKSKVVSLSVVFSKQHIRYKNLSVDVSSLAHLVRIIELIKSTVVNTAISLSRFISITKSIVVDLIQTTQKQLETTQFQIVSLSITFDKVFVHTSKQINITQSLLSYLSKIIELVRLITINLPITLSRFVTLTKSITVNLTPQTYKQLETTITNVISTSISFSKELIHPKNVDLDISLHAQLSRLISLIKFKSVSLVTHLKRFISVTKSKVINLAITSKKRIVGPIKSNSISLLISFAKEIIHSEVIAILELINPTFILIAHGVKKVLTTKRVDLSLISFLSIQVERAFTTVGSVYMQIATQLTGNYSTNIDIINMPLAPVTDYTSGDNPFTPTIAIDGEYIISNGATTPSGGVAGTSVYINLNTDGFPGGACSTFSFNIQLGFGSGTFSITSQNNFATQGESVTIFGLQGVVTKWSRVASLNSYGYVISGIFGSAVLNKQIQLLGVFAGSLLPSQALQTPPSNQWSTVATAAKALADSAGLTLNWIAPDGPLTDLFPQTGQTVGAAIDSLVAQVGAIRVWDGTSNYTVITPNRGVGGASILPDCRMISSIQYDTYLDLEDRIIVFPVSAISAGGTVTLPPPLDPNSVTNADRKIPLWGNTGQLPGPSDPSTYIRLPGDVFEVKAQILISPVDEVFAGGLLTTDPNSWQTFDPGTVMLKDGVRALQITPNTYPSQVSALTQGWQFNVAYTRNIGALANSYNTALGELTATSSYVLNQQQEMIRYVRVASCTITLPFFGTVPLPGQTVSIMGPNSISISGIVESVSLTSPGILNVTIGQYENLNFIVPRNTIGTGTTEVGP